MKGQVDEASRTEFDKGLLRATSETDRDAENLASRNENGASDLV
jgi:hypothetical protein